MNFYSNNYQIADLYPFFPLKSWGLKRVQESCCKADEILTSRKKAIFSNAFGVVLEIGAGTGINRKYLHPSTTYWALEKEPAVSQQLMAVADSVFFSNAESIPLPAESVDCVLCSMVLCSVQDLAKTLNDIFRVLRPDGKLFLIEHVGARQGTWLRLFQRIFRPLCQSLEQGCCPDRDIAVALRSSRLRIVDYTEFQLRLKRPLIHDWIQATLIKPKTLSESL